MPSPPFFLKSSRDPGVTNVRNLFLPNTRRWLAREHRCLVPFRNFAEPKGKGRGLARLLGWQADVLRRHQGAGLDLRPHNVKNEKTTDYLCAFLTGTPNASAAGPERKPVRWISSKRLIIGSGSLNFTCASKNDFAMPVSSCLARTPQESHAQQRRRIYESWSRE